MCITQIFHPVENLHNQCELYFLLPTISCYVVCIFKPTDPTEWILRKHSVWLQLILKSYTLITYLILLTRTHPNPLNFNFILILIPMCTATINLISIPFTHAFNHLIPP